MCYKSPSDVYPHLLMWPLLSTCQCYLQWRKRLLSKSSLPNSLKGYAKMFTRAAWSFSKSSKAIVPGEGVLAAGMGRGGGRQEEGVTEGLACVCTLRVYDACCMHLSITSFLCFRSSTYVLAYLHLHLSIHSSVKPSTHPSVHVFVCIATYCVVSRGRWGRRWSSISRW